MRAMILAAGLGTRLKPFTDDHPKALAVVNGKSLLQRNIAYLHDAGISDIIINTHHFPDQVIAALTDINYASTRISISDETGELLETGGGLKKASWFFDNNEPFILMNVDILTDLSLASFIEAHNISGALATLAVTSRTTSRYFLFDDSGLLSGWRNVSTGEERITRKTNTYMQKAFSGIQIISPRIFPLIPFTGRFSMVEVYLHLSLSEQISAFDHTGSKFIDVGKPESIIEAQHMFA